MTRYPALWIGGAMLLAFPLGCDQSFEPFQETDRIFSIMGFLDASADTQWVRVMPLRHTSAFTSDERSEAVVSLERVGSGNPVTLRDSVFRYRPPFLDPETVVFAHNFWTTEPIQSGESYRLTATRPDDNTATANVTVPEYYPVTVIHNATSTSRALVRVEVEHLPLFQIRCFGASFPYSVSPSISGVYEIEIVRPFVPFLADLCPFEDIEIFVVVSGAPWPSGGAFSASALTILDASSNIEKALGFFGGVFTRSIPWERCFLEPRVGPCPLTYDSRSVNLSGVVTDVDCARPLGGAEIRLREILPDPDVPARVWMAISAGQVGTYHIDSLESGSYELKVSHPETLAFGTPPPRVFQEHVDTLTFGPGEQATLGISLTRQFGCF